MVKGFVISEASPVHPEKAYSIMGITVIVTLEF